MECSPQLLRATHVSPTKLPRHLRHPRPQCQAFCQHRAEESDTSLGGALGLNFVGSMNNSTVNSDAILLRVVQDFFDIFRPGTQGWTVAQKAT